MKNYLFTSESVTIGHPDKMCDYISDSVLDAIYSQDPYSKVACETMAYKNNILVSGEITTNANVDIEAIVRNCIREIGYTDEHTGINYENCKVDVVLSKQSNDIALGVDIGGAGDQGLMFGYATNETAEYMPITAVLANKLARKLEYVRKNEIITGIKPDGKSQVTVEFEDNQVKRIESIVISTQHDATKNMEELRKEIIEKVIMTTVDTNLIDENTKMFVNPTGRFVIGGPLGDVGLTGRKIIIDTYGGAGRHGGGAFSGKDPTKVDRSAAYMARFIAKNVVANNLADRCEIQLSYVIGIKDPASINIDCFGTEKVSEEEILKRIKDKFDLTPNGIIETFKLRRPIYRQLSAYGHMGRIDLDMPWEEIVEL